MMPQNLLLNESLQLDQRGGCIGWGKNYAYFEARKSEDAYRFESRGGSIVAFKATGNGWEELKRLPQL
jgi:hypothetical protein